MSTTISRHGWWTTKEAAKEAGVTAYSIRKYIRKYGGKAFRVRCMGARKIHSADFLRWLETGEDQIK